MQYIALDSYSRKWIFSHRDCPVSDADKEQIKPLASFDAKQLWTQQISQQASHHDHFFKGDWAARSANWKEKISWQEQWESDDLELPEEILSYLEWEDNTPVFFCYDHENVIQTRWDVFKRCWKNFLFFDDGPILIAKKRNQALQFFDDGTVALGQRS